MPHIYIPKNKVHAVRKLLDGYRLTHGYKLTKRRKGKKYHKHVARKPHSIFNLRFS
jgi:hypothetical protein